MTPGAPGKWGGGKRGCKGVQRRAGGTHGDVREDGAGREHHEAQIGGHDVH